MKTVFDIGLDIKNYVYSLEKEAESTDIAQYGNSRIGYFAIYLTPISILVRL